MTQIDPEIYRQLLVKARAELTELAATTDAAAAPVELDQSRVGRLSRMDAMQAQAMSQEAQRRRELQLIKITTALERIAQDEFGYCVRCGDEIAQARLQVEPTSLLCIDCANDSEN